MIRTVFKIECRPGGENVECLRIGWSQPEPTGIWALGNTSKVALPEPLTGATLVLQLDVVPNLAAPEVQSQRLRVLLCDIVIADVTLSQRTRLAFTIPEQALKQRRASLYFEYPDAARLSISEKEDKRALSVFFSHLAIEEVEASLLQRAGTPAGVNQFSGTYTKEAIEAGIGMTLPNLMTSFCSLGDNCELGLIQRQGGAEPLDLLRFASTFLPNLVNGIEDSYSRLGVDDEIVAYLEPAPSGRKREFMIDERPYYITYHPFVYEGEMDPSRLVEREKRRMTFLRRKLIEDLQAGRRIFVVKGNNVSEPEITALALAIAAHGPGWLLWVATDDDAARQGTVVHLFGRVMKGWISKFAPSDDVPSTQLENWLSTIANALLLQREIERRPSEIGSTVDAPDELELHVDRTGLDPEGRSHVWGWAWARSGIQSIGIRIAGKDKGEALFGLPRSGLAEAFPDRSNMDCCGFEFIGEEPHDGPLQDIEVIARSRGGLAQTASLKTPRDELHVDFARQHEGGVDINGWAMSPAGVESIRFSVNGIDIGEVTDWHESPDLQSIFSTIPSAGRARFSFSASTGFSSSKPLPLLTATMRTCANATLVKQSELLAPTPLMFQFESLGGGSHGCEFGLTQRYFGAEPLGLLRFCDVFPDALVNALVTDLDGVGESNFTELVIPEGSEEYWVRDTRYHMAQCTGVEVRKHSYDAAKTMVTRRLTRLRFKLLDELKNPTKILVYKNPSVAPGVDEPVEIFNACRVHAETKLLYVQLACENSPGGTVRVVRPGLMIGYMSQFACDGMTHEFNDFMHDDWLKVCRAAYTLVADR